MNVYVFKTSANSENIRSIDSILQSVIPECHWSYDLEDCDNILRIESDKNIVKSVCSQLEVEGFYCEELE